MSWVRRLADVEQELALLEDEDARREVWRSAQRRNDQGWPSLLFLIAIQLAVGPATITAKIAAHRLGLPSLLAYVLVALLAAVCVVVWFHIRRRSYQAEVRRQLQARGISVCLNCGYSLRGQTEPRCPECGREFDPAALGNALNVVETSK